MMHHLDVDVDLKHVASMADTYGNYVDDACSGNHHYEDDADHDTNDDTYDDTDDDTDTDDADDGGRGNLYKSSHVKSWFDKF